MALTLRLCHLTLSLLLLIKHHFLLISLGYLFLGKLSIEHLLNFKLLFYFHSLDRLLLHLDHRGLRLVPGSTCILVFPLAVGFKLGVTANIAILLHQYFELLVS